jgi:2-oxoglutarate dehydrogenase E2 component (dihydrolipoamide succinyltransferase)
VVPNLRNVENMSFRDIEAAIAQYGQKARANKIAMEDMAGGTFTISNGGVFGSLFGTPILNPPQSAILGMHGIILSRYPSGVGFSINHWYDVMWLYDSNKS